MPIVFLDALRKRIYIYVGYGSASNCPRQPTKQIVSAQAIAPRDCILSRKARDLGESVASVLRKGGVLYIQMKGKGGSQRRKENKQ